MMDRRRMLIGSQAVGRTLLGTGTTSTSGVTWKVWSDGVLEIYASSAKNTIGSINGWNNEWNESITTVSIENISGAGASGGSANTVFENLTNNKTLITGENFGRNVATNYPLKLRYENYYYAGDLNAWCYNRDMRHQNAFYTPYSSNRYNLYLNGVLLEGDVTLPRNGKTGELANVGNIRSVTLSETISTISARCLASCSCTSVTIPNTVTTIGIYAMEYTQITSLYLPDSVTTINAGAFQHIHNLLSMRLPNLLSSIPSSMLSSCDQITEISIPSGVSSISSYAFNGCNALRTIDFSNHIAIPTFGTGSFTGLPSGYRVVVPASLLNDWKAASGWSSIASHIVSA